MALLTSSMPRMDMTDIPRAVRRLTDYVYQLREELEYVAMNLDSDNVTEILTNITKVKSEDGTTEIVGNTLKQTDTKKTRLIMGYDKVHKQFKFEMYDAAGQKTIYMDDNGEAVFAGSVNTSKDIYVGNNIYLKADSPDSKGVYFTQNNNITYGEIAGMRIKSEKAIQIDSDKNILIQAVDGDFQVVTYNGNAILPNNSYLGIAAASNKIARIGDVNTIVNDELTDYARIDYVTNEINDVKAWVEANFEPKV